MKHKSILLGSLVLLGLMGVLYVALNEVTSASNLTVVLAPHKQNYALGEIVEFDVNVTNHGDSDVYLRETPGNVRFFISSDEGKTYRNYKSVSPANGKKKGVTLRADESITLTQTVFCNAVSPVSHLSEASKQRVIDKQIMTVYAFPVASDYYVKAALYTAENGEIAIYQSKPVKISVTAPKSEESRIWEKIKHRADFAYFMQEGGLVDFDASEKRDQFLLEVNEILNEYPDSSYSQVLRQSLIKLRESETRRIELLDKLKKQRSQ